MSRAPVIGIVSARGGAGSTTLGLGLSRYVKDHGRRVSFLDPDPWQQIFLDCSDLQDDQCDIQIETFHRVHEPPIADHYLILIPTEIQAIANVVPLLPQLERLGTCHLVVRTRSGSISPTQIEKVLKVSLAAVVKTDPKIALAGEHGRLRPMRAIKEIVTALGLE